jgi:hypothetical protein
MLAMNRLIRLVLSLLLFVAGCGPLPTTQSPPAQLGPTPAPAPIVIPATGIIRISEDDLLAQFVSDKARSQFRVGAGLSLDDQDVEDAKVKEANRLFRDRIVEVTGKPVHIYTQKTGEPTVRFGEIGSYISSCIECVFSTKDKLDKMNVSKGQTCVIRGRCMGKGSHPGCWLKECVMVPDGE